MYDPEVIDKLRHRFFALWERCLNDGGADEGTGDPTPVWDLLVRNYSSRGRYYHCIAHLVHCLEQHDLALEKLGDPDAVEMAIWFHDVVLEVQSADNERHSAELFQSLVEGRFEPVFVEKVVALILVTDHKTSPESDDQRLLADIDLSSFALPWKHYLRDTEALRRESRAVPDEHYHAGHRRFLEGLLGRQRIFQSSFFHNRYESRARSNIERYLGHLEEHGATSRLADFP
jgi:predicted metal-dependent HD superfamily phosphohydrolase